MQACIDNPEVVYFRREQRKFHGEAEEARSGQLKIILTNNNSRSPQWLTFSGEHLSSGGKAVFSNAIQLSKSAIVKVWTYG